MILLTGVAGFVGFHVARRLLEYGYGVVGIDSLNSYYSIELKRHRLAIINSYPNFIFFEGDISDAGFVSKVFSGRKIDCVINLAAQAGVRYSIECPQDYTSANLVGFFNILEACRRNDVAQLIYASSSSVYGEKEGGFFRESDETNSPLSYYAATKKSNEMMAASYSYLYKFSTTGLRFFSVYGELGRPDMAYYKFAMNMLEGQPIDVYNNGDMWRDFTYVDDVVESIVRLCKKPTDGVARVFNIGCGNPVRLGHMLDMLAEYLDVRPVVRYLPKPSADVSYTAANVDLLESYIDFKPQTDFDLGLLRFVNWYKGYRVNESAR